jgi:flagellar motor switch protein FliM
VDSEPILSRDEIEALLSAIRPPDAPSPSILPWDFRRPRRLRSGDLDRLRDLHRPRVEALTRVFESWLHAPVQVRLLNPVETTAAELLEGRPDGTLLARAGEVLLDPSPAVAFALVERALGAGRVSRPPDRPLRDLEAELISPVLVGLLDALAPVWAPEPPAPLKWALRETLYREAWPEGSMAVVGVEILSEGLMGDVWVAVPVGRFEPMVGRVRPADSNPSPGVDIEVSARFPLGTLRLADLRGLATGDLLVWGGDPVPGITLEVGRTPRFAGRPGVLKGRLAVEVLRPAGPEPAPAPLERRSGGAAPAGTPEVPVEIRAVLAERSIGLGALAGLRPGVVIEFARSADEPVELRLGNRTVAQGSAVRVGDRLAVRVE